MTESNVQTIRIFALYAAFAVLLVLGINTLAPWSGLQRPRPAPAHDGRVHTIRSVADFEEMLAQERAALFVDAGWDIASAGARPVFAEYARSPTGWDAPDHFYQLEWEGRDDALNDRLQEWLDARGILYRPASVIWTRRGDVSNYVDTHGSQSAEVSFYAALTHWSDGLPFYFLAALLVPAIAAACRFRWRFSLRSLAATVAVIAMGCLAMDPHRATATRILIDEPRLWWHWYGGTIVSLFVVSSLLTPVYFMVRRLRRRLAPRDAQPASSLER